MLDATIQKLAKVPEDIEVATLTDCPQGWQIAVIHYKTDSETKIKKPSEAWMIPTLEVDAEFGSKKMQNAVVKFIAGLQMDALRELAAGDIDYRNLISDVDALCEDYYSDRRGTREGPKQSQLNDWIAYTMIPFLKARIEANLTNEKGYNEDKRMAMLGSYAKKFKLAATRGNRSANETLSDEALKDLQQRLELYTGSEDKEKNLPKSIELDAIVARIKGHREAIAKSNLEVTADQF